MAQKRAFYTQLWFWVLVATVAGIALGWRDPTLGKQLKPLGDAFIALVRGIIAPVIFCTVVHGIAAMHDLRRAGRVALKALVYFEAVTTFALLFALVAVDLWQPGAGMKIDAHALDAHLAQTYVAQAHAQTATGLIQDIIPDSFVGAFVQGSVLPVLFVSVLFGFALASLGARGRMLVTLIGEVSEVVFRIVGFIMWAAPVGAFGAVAFTVGAFGVTTLVHLGSLIAEFYVTCFLFVFAVFGAILWALRINLLRLLYVIRDELAIVAATTSTETVLPRIIEKLRGLGCEESLVGLVVPAGYSFNLDGTCLYLVTVTMFLAQATHTPMRLGDELGLIVIMLLSSKGAAGVAGAALVALTATLSAAGTIPVAAIVIVLGIHRVLAEALTFVNVVGNCAATIVVSRWEGTADEQTLQAAIGLG
jgi:aerobic C4-dicarboxylate transport protein